MILYHTTEIHAHLYMFISALFIIARKWNQLWCPSVDGGIRKNVASVHNEFYSPAKKSENYRKMDGTGKHYISWGGPNAERLPLCIISFRQVLPFYHIMCSCMYINRCKCEWRKPKTLERSREDEKMCWGGGRLQMDICDMGTKEVSRRGM